MKKSSLIEIEAWSEFVYFFFRAPGEEYSRGRERKRELSLFLLPTPKLANKTPRRRLIDQINR